MYLTHVARMPEDDEEYYACSKKTAKNKMFHLLQQQ